MKKTYVLTALTAILMFLILGNTSIRSVWQHRTLEQITVGFLYDGDESTPHTYNFIRAQMAAEKELEGKIRVLVKSNVPHSENAQAIAKLADAGCDIIFAADFTSENAMKQAAQTYPQIQFCQACGNNADAPAYENYHTFMGHIYEGRYVAGVAAGMKLSEMIEAGKITPQQAVLGYVGAYPNAEVISGYTAFLLGARSVVPEATLHVKYVLAWSNYTLEKAAAQALIEDGCVILSQHTDTAGPAVACEEAGKEVYYVGYNQSTLGIAPKTTLTGTRINWTPYVTGAIRAVLDGQDIESSIDADIHGNDAGAGFDKDWVQILEVNSRIAADGTQQRVEQEIAAFQRGKRRVFVGDYIGVNPADETDTYDLNNGYIENEWSSSPTFSYVLKNIIIE